MQIEEKLARFVCELQEADVPASAQRVMRQMVLAVVGTGIAGADEDGIGALRDLLREAGGTPQATTLVFGDRLPAHAAAQFNGTMCRALDYCDAMAPGPHIGSALFPAALAAAELAGGCTGRRVHGGAGGGCRAQLAPQPERSPVRRLRSDRDRRALLGRRRRSAHPEAHAAANAACARAGLQPLRRQFPEPCRRIARRALRAGLGGRGRRAMRAHGAARRDGSREFPDRPLRLPPPLWSRHARHGKGRRESRRGLAAAPDGLQEVSELRRHSRADRARPGARRGRTAGRGRSVGRGSPAALRVQARGQGVRPRREPPGGRPVQRRLLRRERPGAPDVQAAALRAG